MTFRSPLPRDAAALAIALLGALAACRDNPTQPAAPPEAAPLLHAASTPDGRPRIVYDSPSDVAVVGTAFQYSGGIALNLSAQGQVGAAWFTERQKLDAGFQAVMRFQILPASCAGLPPADGLAFVIQNDPAGVGALGAAGGGIGYHGLQRGLAVEFDTWFNAESFINDPNANHVTVMGNTTGLLLANHAGSLGTIIPPFALVDGAVHTAVFDYYPGGPFEIRLDGSPSPNISLAVDLSAILAGDGTAWVGFTGATGAACETNLIRILPNTAPVASLDGPYTTLEGSPAPLTATGTDAEGDPLTFAWDTDNDGAFDDGTTASVSPTFADDGVYLVRVRVTDHHGLSSVAMSTVTVFNVAPALGPISAPATPVAVGSSIVASASFTDPGTLDTHTGTIDWGDGVTSTGSTTFGGGSGTLSGSHAYASAGVYTVVMTVADDDGGSGTRAFQYVVVYDPTAGFVTGGGWINSPVGACQDVALCGSTDAGRATFGFVSRYHRGATVPTGNTQFQYHAGDFSFRSTSYEWLVIAGARAQYKGSGTIDGAGDYAFLLTATDGQVAGGGGVDRFRIKIWDRATGAVIYDNVAGAADDLSATPQAVGGGSIHIQAR